MPNIPTQKRKPHPTRPLTPVPPVPPRPAPREFQWWRLLLTAWLVAVPSVLSVVFLTMGQGRYGYALFVALPTAAGIICGLLVNAGKPWNWRASLFAATLTALAVMFGLLLLKIEGMGCIAMAAGLLWALMMFGLLIAWIVQKIAKSHQARRNLILIAICSVPLCSAVELQVTPQLEIMEQTTEIEIDAPPSEVWRFVPGFPDITTPPSWLFKSGVAYPLRSEMDGSGVGAQRRCVLTTGMMDEIVTQWEPDRLLEFNVLTGPPAMTEASIYDHVETPHLNGYFVPQRGRFVLTPLPNGRTRLTGTSWYSHQIWPKAYWSPITRRIVKEIHQRVLEHIKTLAEAH